QVARNKASKNITPSSACSMVRENQKRFLLAVARTNALTSLLTLSLRAQRGNLMLGYSQDKQQR
ncbi:MAG: hypothetical protein OQK76_05415, partial [Gammaproteobacteria bacterium]|nr:hypothetical protein [Gammaproteobacteria bacterium]